MTLHIAVKHRFPNFELDLEFCAGAGVTALFGHSGAGKTTVINAIAGLSFLQHVRIRLGETVFDGPSTRLPAHRRRIGYVFQEPRLFPHLSVAQNLDYAGRFDARPRDRARIIEMLGIGPFINQMPATLSGGQSQRVALGRALLSDPQLLLMDEPLAALDVPRKAEILPYIERLKAETRIPIVYVSHALDEIARLADEMIVLENGRVCAKGDVFQVLSDPKLVRHFGVRETGTVLSAIVRETARDGITRVESGVGDFFLMGVKATEGAQIRLRLLAQDIMISREFPSGLSALNVMPAQIHSMTSGAGPGVMLQLSAGSERILARITVRAMESLNLKKGDHVYAVVKTSAVGPASMSGGSPTPV